MALSAVLPLPSNMLPAPSLPCHSCGHPLPIAPFCREPNPVLAEQTVYYQTQVSWEGRKQSLLLPDQNNSGGYSRSSQTLAPFPPLTEKVASERICLEMSAHLRTSLSLEHNSQSISRNRFNFNPRLAVSGRSLWCAPPDPLCPLLCALHVYPAWTGSVGCHALWLTKLDPGTPQIRVWEKTEVSVLRSSYLNFLLGSPTSCLFGPRNSSCSLLQAFLVVPPSLTHIL